MLLGSTSQTPVHKSSTNVTFTDVAQQAGIDFVNLSRSLGVPAERAKTVHEATDLLKKALQSGGPMLIDVELDRAFKPM